MADYSNEQWQSPRSSVYAVSSFASEWKNRWAVILAGGDGERLRPLTRLIAGHERPKQFCGFLGGETLLELTRRRVALAVSPTKTLSVVTATHEPFYAPLLSDLPPSHVIAQPANQGTAPAILYSLLRVAAVAPTEPR